MGKLEGKVALVTGGTSGIGLATAKRFVQEGAFVFITGRRDRELRAAVKDVGASVTGVQGDVSNLTDLDRLFTEIRDAKVQLDVVFPNAGTARYAPLGEITEELYESILNTKARSAVMSFLPNTTPGRDGRMLAETPPASGSRCSPMPGVWIVKQVSVVAELTRIVAAAATDESVKDRVWVLVTEAPDGGWGLAGHAHTNAELVAAARAQLGKQ